MQVESHATLQFCFRGIPTLDVPNNILKVLILFKVLDPYVDLSDNGGDGGYDRFTALKTQNSALKTTLSVGGWEEGPEKFSAVSI